MENFKIALKKYVSLSEESWCQLSEICAKKTFGKNDFVLKHEAVCNGIYFVSSGLLRNFYFKDNKEISEWFAFEHSFCFSIISYFNKVPSYLGIQCLEDSEIITISHDGLMKLKNENFEIANLAFALISGSLIASQQRMMSLQFETALQRYEHLLKAHNNMLQRIPLHYIASYLGVSAETLSRIRKQVH
jgi:CRP-like cAMP-binding protein